MAVTQIVTSDAIQLSHKWWCICKYNTYQIMIIKKSIYFYQNFDKVFEKICKSYCK